MMKMISGVSKLSKLLLLLSTIATVTGTKIQAENASIRSNIAILNRHSGFEGTGYADYGDVGSFLTFNYNAQGAGDYEIKVRYSARVSRELDLIVDNSNKGKIAVPTTSGWDSWRTDSSTVFLSDGSHAIKLLAVSTSGPNVDWLSVEKIGGGPAPNPPPVRAPAPAPVPQPTPSSGAILYEAENANVKNNVDINDRHEGFSGTGYADYGDVGSYLTWNNVVASEDEDYDIIIRYASRSNRPLQLIIDNGAQEVTFACVHTGEWDNWVEEMQTVSLSEGSHTFKLLAQYSTGPNIDSISVELSGGPKDTPIGPPVPAPVPAPVPVPTPTNLNEVIYTPNQAVLYEVDLLTANGGYEFEGYGDYKRAGSFMEWAVDAPISGNHEIIVRYAAKNTRPTDLFIDNARVLTYPFNGAGDWTTWREESMVVYLAQGMRTIKFLAVTSPGPNLNWISVRPISGAPIPAPVPAPIPAPVPAPTGGNFPESIVLGSNQRLERNQFIDSPNGDFKVGLTSGGDLVLRRRNNQNIWTAGVSGGFRCYMQSDGNMIIRDSNNRAKWVSNTYDHPGARLIVDDGGRIAVMVGSLPIWMDGLPRGVYTGPSSANLQYPIRGVFYYPWYPETWTVNGQYAHFEPDIGFYSSSDQAVAENHIDAFEYAHVDLSIASWWGPETNLDRARLTMMMDETIKMGSSVKWTIYHEDEKAFDPSPSAIRDDLDYLMKWFAWHPAWAHIDGRPVVFVYNEGGCEIVDRWMEASNGDWFVVLKLFSKYTDCPTQPDAWHQYGVGDGYLQYDNVSVTLAPGFWRADRNTPDFPRVSRSQWCDNVEKMVESNEPFQLIVSFNEAGEGTMIEASSAWSSSSGYGYYLDCLNQYY